MTQKLNYNTFDVFTTEPFTGNQLGLVHVPAGFPLTQEQKQKLTIEFNYSETVFLHQPDQATAAATYNAQIFTPKSELPFAGHPTIGTAVWIFDNLEKDRDEITINLKAGPVAARYNRREGIATAAIPHNVRIHATTMPWQRVCQSQPGLAVAKDSLSTSTAPLVSIVPGLEFVLVDLSPEPELLNEVKPTKDDIAQSQDLDEDLQSSSGLIGNVFYRMLPDRGDGVLRVRQRVMVIELEDPATGSASSALAVYLALEYAKRGDDNQYKIEIEQGIEMGRASKIFVNVLLTEDGKAVETVELKGQAVEVMGGQLRVV